MRWTPDDVCKTRQDALVHSIGKSGIPGCPAQATQLCIAHTFVAITAFTLLHRFPDRRQWAIQPTGQPAVTFALQNGLIIDHVVNLSALCFSAEQKEECGRDIVSMKLVNEAIVFGIADSWS